MTVEASLWLSSAWMARSPALLAFDGDGAIELLSAAAVLWRSRSSVQERSEKQVARIVATLLFMLAAYVAVTSAITLLGHREAKTTHLGITIGAAAIMPRLAKEIGGCLPLRGVPHSERMLLNPHGALSCP
jgi:hypothetical protein